MNLTEQIAQHFRGVFFGGNWTTVNLKATLADVTWGQATREADGFNTIVQLTYHIGYFVGALLKVLRGGPLDAHDKYSFDHPPIHSQKDWETLRDTTLADAEALAAIIEQLPESRLWETMVLEQYGNYYRNIHGIIEHTHYHLGQIVVIKKLAERKIQNSEF